MLAWSNREEPKSNEPPFITITPLVAELSVIYYSTQCSSLLGTE